MGIPVPWGLQNRSQDMMSGLRWLPQFPERLRHPVINQSGIDRIHPRQSTQGRNRLSNFPLLFRCVSQRIMSFRQQGIDGDNIRSVLFHGTPILLTARQIDQSPQGRQRVACHGDSGFQSGLFCLLITKLLINPCQQFQWITSFARERFKFLHFFEGDFGLFKFLRDGIGLCRFSQPPVIVRVLLAPLLPNLQISLLWQTLPRPVCLGSKCLRMLSGVLCKLSIESLQGPHVFRHGIMNCQSIAQSTEDPFDRVDTVFGNEELNHQRRLVVSELQVDR